MAEVYRAPVRLPPLPEHRSCIRIALGTPVAAVVRDFDEEVRRCVADEVDAKPAKLEGSGPRRSTRDREAAIERFLRAFAPGRGDVRARP
jgi:hypothetical protein